jgi:hypothetical protein
MLDLCRILFGVVIDLFRPRAALEAEILVLRQQIIVLRRGRRGRMPFIAIDRIVFAWLCYPVSEGPRGARHSPARHRAPVAPRRVLLLLAMEIEAPSRPANGAG